MTEYPPPAGPPYGRAANPPYPPQHQQQPYQPPYQQPPYQQPPPYAPPQGAGPGQPYGPGPGPQDPPPYAPAPYQEAGDEQRRIQRQAGQRAMIFGALWLLGGLLLTVITYSAASGGGVYVVAWGPALYGIFQVVRGIILIRKADA